MEKKLKYSEKELRYLETLLDRLVIPHLGSLSLLGYTPFPLKADALGLRILPSGGLGLMTDHLQPLTSGRSYQFGNADDFLTENNPVGFEIANIILLERMEIIEDQPERQLSLLLLSATDHGKPKKFKLCNRLYYAKTEDNKRKGYVIDFVLEQDASTLENYLLDSLIGLDDKPALLIFEELNLNGLIQHYNGSLEAIHASKLEKPPSHLRYFKPNP